MKYIITGSLGNISLPITKNLVAAGKDVTVISSIFILSRRLKNWVQKLLLVLLMTKHFLMKLSGIPMQLI
jgi:hypothetical protein